MEFDTRMSAPIEPGDIFPETDPVAVQNFTKFSTQILSRLQDFSDCPIPPSVNSSTITDFFINSTSYRLLQTNNKLVVEAVTPIDQQSSDRWFVNVDMTQPNPLHIVHAHIQNLPPVAGEISRTGGIPIEILADTENQSQKEAEFLLGEFLTTIGQNPEDLRRNVA